MILACAAEMFARRGVGATTVRDIGDAVGVQSGSLYHHFTSKDAIVEEILAGFLTAIQARYAEVMASGAPPARCLHDLIRASLEVAADRPYATAIYQNDLPYLREQPLFGDVLKAAASVQRTWLQVIEQGVADGAFRTDIDARLFYRLIRDAVWLSARWQHPASPAKLADAITAIFLDGFSAAGT